MTTTSIEWTQRPGTKGEVWNPVTGCTKVSQGCANCYAENVAKRFWEHQYAAVEIPGGTRPRSFTDVRTHPERLEWPLRSTKPRTYFVNSMSDLFHEAIPDSFVRTVFDVMARSGQHTFIVLTKRPERMKALLNSSAWIRDMVASGYGGPNGSLPNVWLGVSVEDQPTADARIPLLKETPAALRLVSYEPALEAVDFIPHILPATDGMGGIDWVIVGGESGPGARRCDMEWVRTTVEQCAAWEVPCFVKQLGSHPWFGLCGGGFPHDTVLKAQRAGGTIVTGWLPQLKSRKGGDPAEWPTDLRVQVFPEVSC